jgi:hypothetical protein
MQWPIRGARLRFGPFERTGPKISSFHVSESVGSSMMVGPTCMLSALGGAQWYCELTALSVNSGTQWYCEVLTALSVNSGTQWYCEVLTALSVNSGTQWYCEVLTALSVNSGTQWYSAARRCSLRRRWHGCNGCVACPT